MSVVIRKPANTNPRGTASRSWRVLLIYKRGQVLGTVEAPSREAAEAAEAAAVREFNLTPEQRSRLVVQERAKYYE
jgi:acyl-CoA reductase-like NAD-dependent aldehyde dehydrogenase